VVYKIVSINKTIRNLQNKIYRLVPVKKSEIANAKTPQETPQETPANTDQNIHQRKVPQKTQDVSADIGTEFVKEYVPAYPWWDNVLFMMIKNYFWTRRTQSDQMNDNGGEDLLEIGVRWSTNGALLHVTEPSAIKQILLDSDWEKRPLINQSHSKTLLGDSLFFLKNKNAQVQRKVLNPAFKREKLSQLIGKFSEKAYEMQKTWRNSNQLIDVDPWIKKLTFDVVGYAGFGLNLQSLSDENNENKRNFDTTFKGLFNPLDFIFGSLYTSLPLKKFRDIKEATVKSKQLIQEKIINKQQSAETDSDILGFILSQKGDLTDEQIMSNMFLFFLAGQETTASNLVAAMYYLAINPEIQEQAFQEVEKNLKMDEEVNYEILTKLLLVEAIVRETMRLHNGFSAMSVRVTSKDTEILGYKIPKDTPVTMNLVPAHLSKKYWDEPMVFKPSRFLGEERNRNLGRLFIFAMGPRICLGHKFAMYEMVTTLAVLLRHFSWTIDPNFKWKSKFVAITRMPEGGLPLKMKTRTE
jgi:cytochrome P450